MSQLASSLTLRRASKETTVADDGIIDHVISLPHGDDVMMTSPIQTGRRTYIRDSEEEISIVGESTVFLS